MMSSQQIVNNSQIIVSLCIQTSYADIARITEANKGIPPSTSVGLSPTGTSPNSVSVLTTKDAGPTTPVTTLLTSVSDVNETFDKSTAPATSIAQNIKKTGKTKAACGSGDLGSAEVTQANKDHSASKSASDYDPNLQRKPSGHSAKALSQRKLQSVPNGTCSWENNNNIERNKREAQPAPCASVSDKMKVSNINNAVLISASTSETNKTKKVLIEDTDEFPDITASFGMRRTQSTTTSAGSVNLNKKNSNSAVVDDSSKKTNLNNNVILSSKEKRYQNSEIVFDNETCCEKSKNLLIATKVDPFPYPRSVEVIVAVAKVEADEGTSSSTTPTANPGTLVLLFFYYPSGCT
jgi:hypothetical protein